LQHQADGIRITVLVENWIDILLAEEEFIGRPGLVHHFNPRNQVVQAENGFSLFIESWAGDKRSCVLFDTGLGPDVIVHNFEALGIDPPDIDQIVISHGHLDHHGGLATILPLIGHEVPVVIHPDAFLPRYVVMANREIGPYYNRSLAMRELEDLGARWILTRQPVPVAPGILTSGEIPLETDFEGPTPSDGPALYEPGLYQVRDNQYVSDMVTDEQALVASVKDEGLAVITGCGHRGVINTVRQARRIAEEEPLALVAGGFHLGFPGTPKERVEKTVDALCEVGTKRIVPMHCSGFDCMSQIAARMPDEFLQYMVGMTIDIGDVG
jgi:7,8-dihydropterin-6-yl-methyl-4-(beta-D-ribofuranosyl)aminobenzene 5'-phosphate synthase